MLGRKTYEKEYVHACRGNPLNEVRVLCNSILLNGGKLRVDKLPGWSNSAGSGIKLPPEISDAKAFFACLEEKYV